MRVDIWSDVVCPWCYIGKARFDMALGVSGAQATETFETALTQASERGRGKTSS